MILGAIFVANMLLGLSDIDHIDEIGVPDLEHIDSFLHNVESHMGVNTSCCLYGQYQISFQNSFGRLS